MNSVCVCGTVASPPKPVPETATPCCTTRVCVHELGKDGQTYKLWVGLEAWGPAAIMLEPLPLGSMIGVSGKLKYKTWLGKEGKKEGSLIITTFSIEVLPPAAVPPGKEA